MFVISTEYLVHSKENIHGKQIEVIRIGAKKGSTELAVMNPQKT